eukprot:TRINITY_DN4185_c0_g4_i1.p1 TRINITY_DN4185_c0_g4~~TRINITY_DN4185_c0_g4_i1.p1  ORF type:complete len:731 (-),score=158.97 TRINITY_DN4185_c0_g4_i1:416-2608(-)
MGCVYAKQSSSSTPSFTVPATAFDSSFQIHNNSNCNSFKKERVEDSNGFLLPLRSSSSSSLAADKGQGKKQSGRFEVHLGVEEGLKQNCRGGNVDSVRYPNPPKCYTEAEQVAAGWPSWLTTVACEAIRGWIPRKADSFEKLDKIGQGTYSNVYKARDLDSGKIVALKKVRFDNLEPESVRFMAREIQVLRRLNHPNVIRLEGLVTSRMSCSLYLVFEYMEHDLAGLMAHPSIKFTEPQVKCYMQQLLSGLDHCHGNGVLHRDIKGSNLLIDNKGILKIADFGLATFFCPGQKQPLTSRVVTLWYRPPELLLGATDYGVGVDLWSAGCLLAELLSGKPILPGRTEVEQLHKIFKLCGSPSDDYWKKTKLPHATIFKPQQPYKRCITETFKDFPYSALSLIETLLAIEASSRGTAASALKSEFFLTKPFACEPSSLPKYPPSKELDVKIRDDEARRKKFTAGKVRLPEMGKKGSRESRAVPAPDGNAELITSIQKRRLDPQANSKSKSEMFSSRDDDGAVGFPIEPPRVAMEGPGVSRAQVLTARLPLMNDKIADGRMSKEDVQTDPVSVPKSIDNSSAVPTEKANAVQPGASLSINCTSSSNPTTNWQDSHDNKKEQHCLTHGNKIEDSSAGTRVEKKGSMEPFSTYDPQEDRVEYSGPLLSQSANIDQLLERHERRIQQAVRRVRQDKSRVQKNTLSHTRWKITEYKNWISRGNGGTTHDIYSKANAAQ